MIGEHLSAERVLECPACNCENVHIRGIQILEKNSEKNNHGFKVVFWCEAGCQLTLRICEKNFRTHLVLSKTGTMAAVQGEAGGDE